MGSTFGHTFRVTTFGESHGPAVGCVIDGCPANVEFSITAVQHQLDRRRPGQSKIVTQRQELDQVEVLSGVHDGRTLGTPIALLVRNEDSRSKDYKELKDKFRPSHADYTYLAKYGLREWAGGGRASARETVGRVAAGAVASQLLYQLFEVETVAWVDSVQKVQATVDHRSVSRDQVDGTIVRCPDSDAAGQMLELIESIRKSGDSVGGVVGCVSRGVPAGWGEPVFDKLEADLAKAMLSLPACKGFESGLGFGATKLKGSEHNDAFRSDEVLGVMTPTNNSGGIQGGISNAMPILIKAAFKPVATIMMEQDTVDTDFVNTTITGRGRHDPCVLPRAVPMVEAMVSLVLADHCLRNRSARL